MKKRLILTLRQTADIINKLGYQPNSFSLDHNIRLFYNSTVNRDHITKSYQLQRVKWPSVLRQLRQVIIITAYKSNRAVDGTAADKESRTGTTAKCFIRGKFLSSPTCNGGSKSSSRSYHSQRTQGLNCKALKDGWKVKISTSHQILASNSKITDK